MKYTQEKYLMLFSYFKPSFEEYHSSLSSQKKDTHILCHLINLEVHLYQLSKFEIQERITSKSWQCSSRA